MTAKIADKKYYVSVTGLKLSSFLHLPKFWYYNMPTMRQAKNAKGNISVDGNYIDGLLHTLSVWEDKQAMTKFYRSGAHAQAMKMTGSVAESTKIYGYETDRIPTWEEALTIWSEKGRTIRFDKRQTTSRARSRSFAVAIALVPAVLAILSYRFRILAA